MKRVKITAVRITEYADLMKLYELPMEEPCCLHEGDTFISENARMPQHFCESAWETIRGFVEQLANGEGHFFGEWMKNPYSAMLSCNDGFRPVSFLIEAVDE